MERAAKNQRTPTADPLGSAARSVTPSTPDTLDQLDSGDRPAIGCWWTSGGAFGRWRCVLVTEAKTLAHARHTGRSTRRYHRVVSAQIEHPQEQPSSQKQTEQWVFSAASEGQGLLSRAIVSSPFPWPGFRSTASGNSDNLIIPFMHVTNSRCRAMWLPSQIHTCSHRLPTLVKDPITLTFRALRRSHIASKPAAAETMHTNERGFENVTDKTCELREMKNLHALKPRRAPVRATTQTMLTAYASARNFHAVVYTFPYASIHVDSEDDPAQEAISVRNPNSSIHRQSL